MDDVNDDSSSDRLVQATRCPSSNLASDYASTMASNDIESSKKLLEQESAQGTPPKSLELDDNNRKPTYSSLKNWVRLASFEKSDLSPSSKSISSNISANNDNSNVADSQTGDDKVIRDDDSRTSDGTMDSPAKKSLLWKDKNKLKLPGLQNDGSSAGRSSGQGSDVTPGQRFLSAAMAVHASVRLSRVERAKRRAKWAGKKILVFMLSNIGLILLMLLYATAGGFLFRWLEKDVVTPSRVIVPSTEQQVGDKAEPEIAPPLAEIHLEHIRKKYVKMMWNETISFNVFHPISWSGNISRILKQFEAKVYEAILEAAANATGDGTKGDAEPVVDRDNSLLKQEDVEEKWTIPASLLFSTTVITSIGYGDITPKTTAGKLVCIPFAMVGIPLTLLTLANIGQLMAASCRFAWRRLTQCGRLCGSKNGSDDCKQMGVTLGSAGAVAFCHIDCPQFISSARYNIITHVRFGACFGDNGCHYSVTGDGIPLYGGPFIGLGVGSLDKSEDDKKCPEKTRVPISVSICIMVGYTSLGALIFSSWEKGWSFLDGFYFSFITLSTIGFGDLVPGQYERSSNERRVVCVLYLLIGLSLLSMVFQLMVDSVMEVVEKLAKLFGLSKEQINEEIEGIDETTNPVPNLVLPDPPKVSHSVHNHNNQMNNLQKDAPQSSGEKHTSNNKQLAENIV